MSTLWIVAALMGSLVFIAGFVWLLLKLSKKRPALPTLDGYGAGFAQGLEQDKVTIGLMAVNLNKRQSALNQAVAAADAAVQGVEDVEARRMGNLLARANKIAFPDEVKVNVKGQP